MSLHWGEADNFSYDFKLPIKFETAVSVTKKEDDNDDNNGGDEDVAWGGGGVVARVLPTFF